MIEDRSFDQLQDEEDKTDIFKTLDRLERKQQFNKFKTTNSRLDKTADASDIRYVDQSNIFDGDTPVDFQCKVKKTDFTF